MPPLQVWLAGRDAVSQAVWREEQVLRAKMIGATDEDLKRLDINEKMAQEMSTRVWWFTNGAVWRSTWETAIRRMMRGDSFIIPGNEEEISQWADELWKHAPDSFTDDNRLMWMICYEEWMKLAHDLWGLVLKH